MAFPAIQAGMLPIEREARIPVVVELQLGETLRVFVATSAVVDTSNDELASMDVLVTVSTGLSRLAEPTRNLRRAIVASATVRTAVCAAS